MRGAFDVTGKLHPGGKNALAVRIEKNATPGSVKEKTFESPGIERRRAGRGQSHLSRFDRLGLDPHDPRPQHRHLERRVPDHHRAGDDREPVRDHHAAAARHLARGRHLEATLRNHDAAPVTGTSARPLRRRRPFETPVTLDAGARRPSSSIPPQRRRCACANPKLWWPAGYGDPNLYPVELNFVTGGRPGLRHEVVPGRRAAVHLQRRGRRAADLDQRPALRRRAAATGASPNPCCATARANTTPPCATTAT